MTKQEQYNILHDENYFIQNKYLDEYISLIELNRDTKYINGMMQKHHIIQRKYFKIINQQIDNSLINIVNLTFCDHCIAHYLLYLCSKHTDLKKANIAAIRNLTNLSLTDFKSNYNTGLLNSLQNDYAKLVLSLMSHYIDKEALYDYYIIKNNSRDKTAQFFNCSRQNIDKWLHYYQIYKNKTNLNTPRAIVINKEKFYTYYIAENHTQKQTADYFKISTGKVKLLMRKYGFTKGFKLERKSRQKLKLSQKELYHLYIEKNLTLDTLAKQNKVSITCIKKYLKLYNIKKR